MELISLNRALIHAYKDGYRKCRFRGRGIHSYHVSIKYVLVHNLKNNFLGLQKEIWIYKKNIGLIEHAMNKNAFLFLFPVRDKQCT